jgi:ABC-2 type transport system ATP-binding protein
MIEIKNLSKKYPGSKNFSVKNVSLSLQKGEVFGFLGHNGAGKTTTMKMIMGFLQPTNGEISINGNPPDSQESKKIMGFLPEHVNLYRYLSAREFLRFCGEMFSLPPEILEPRIEELLVKKLQFPKEAIDRPIKGYSKGMQQRVGIAQALINNPEIIFLDEPMSGLDPMGRKTIKDVILQLKKEGKTIFFNSHILNDAEVLCDKVAIIKSGEIILSGSIKEVTQNGQKTLEEVFIETF